MAAGDCSTPEGTVPLVADVAGQIAGFVIVGSPEREAGKSRADDGGSKVDDAYSPPVTAMRYRKVLG